MVKRRWKKRNRRTLSLWSSPYARIHAVVGGTAELPTRKVRQIERRENTERHTDEVTRKAVRLRAGFAERVEAQTLELSLRLVS